MDYISLMLIKNARLAVMPDRIAEHVNINIENGKIAGFEADKTDDVIDGSNYIVMPGLVNAHTHAAMTLFRGVANDMTLDEWLNRHIWPAEAKMTEKHVYAGAMLACMEMIKSGTTCFSDMYWHWHGTANAVEETGMRAALNEVFIDSRVKDIEINKKLFAESRKYPERIKFHLGPHAIYTVSKQSLEWFRDFAQENKLITHVHLSETKNEVDECIRKNGMRPVEYLYKIGLLGERTIAAHCCWLSDNEIEILRKTKTNIVHCPTSNMKLTSGVMNLEKMKGMNIGIGTDGAASNNSLNMFTEMKTASLLNKIITNSPMAAKAEDVLRFATENGAKMLGFDYGIKADADADLILINIVNPSLSPLTKDRLTSHLVYSFNGNVDTSIINGNIIMKNGKIENEERIYELAEKSSFELLE